jgi:hypothetical protein
MPHQTILETVAQYYAEKLRTFGATPRGVDWNSEDSQHLRFDQLMRLVPEGQHVSLNDYGCGYGALADYLAGSNRPVDYRGYDVSVEMIDAARERHRAASWCSFTSQPHAMATADYSVASGIFNVKLQHAPDVWRAYMFETLEVLDRLSMRGFAFNVLSTSADPDKRRADLYYADPIETLEFCVRRFSARVALLHDYPLYEFTMIVRK